MRDEEESAIDCEKIQEERRRIKVKSGSYAKGEQLNENIAKSKSLPFMRQMIDYSFQILKIKIFYIRYIYSHLY